MSKREFIEKLFVDRSEYAKAEQAEMAANLLDVTASDIYSESHRFAFELIQNADDSAVSVHNEVQFIFLPGVVVIRHKGKPFGEADILSLTSAGSSTKKLDPEKTGYKGIGFKSVFGRSKRVTILSDAYQFRFDKDFHSRRLPWQVIPIWTESQDLPPAVRNLTEDSEFSVCTVLELGDSDKLQADLIEILNTGQILLFLRRTSHIKVVSRGHSVLEISRKQVAKGVKFDEVVLGRDGKDVSAWIVKRFDKIPIPDALKEVLKRDDKTPEKLKEGGFTELSFAAQVVDGRLSPLKPQTGLIYTFLPTKVVEFDFPFLVNGSFITNAGREAIHEDRVWNQWLFQLIAEKMFGWMAVLSQSRFKLQVLNILRLKYDFAGNSLKTAFNKAFEKSINRYAFIATEQGEMKKVSEILLDRTALSLQKFIAPRAIVDFANDVLGARLRDDCFVNHLLEGQPKLKALGVPILELENVDLFFLSRHFIRYHQVAENFELIKYLKSKSDADAEGIWFQKLRSIPFIYDQASILRNPKNGVCFPVEIFDDEVKEIPKIHADVFQQIENDRVIFDWLQKLGVKEPSQITYVTNVIIPGIRQGNYITDQNFQQITRYLLRLFRDRALEIEVLEALRELPLKAQNGSFYQAQNCYLADAYHPAFAIEKIITGLEFVSDAYMTDGYGEQEWRQFFKAIKVKDQIDVETINGNCEIPTIRALTSSAWIGACHKAAAAIGGYGFYDENEIKNVKIPSFLKLTSKHLAFAQLFWENLLVGNNLQDLSAKATFWYGMGYGKNRYGIEVDNFFAWFVKNERCIPTSSKEILISTEVYLNKPEIIAVADTYLPIFNYSGAVSEEWRRLFSFRERLSIDDYLMVLDKIAARQSGDRHAVTAADRKRIGLIYNYLTTLAVHMDGHERDKIRAWADTGKLLSASGDFELAAELQWIRIDGFEGGAKNLRVIAIPTICDIAQPGFEILMELFQVRSIREFFPRLVAPRSDQQLKRKLQGVLPYYVAIVEREKYEQGEFDRLYKLIDTTDFIVADSIILSFEHSGEVVPGPVLRAYRDDRRFYYSGRPTSPITLFELIPELAKLFEITGLNDELRLLLTADLDEIKEWMEDQEYDLSGLHPMRPFSLALFPGEGAGDGHVASNGENVHRDEQNVIGEEVLVESVIEQPFVPDVEPDQVDMRNVSFGKRSGIRQRSIVTTGGRFGEMTDQGNRDRVGRWAEEIVNREIREEKYGFSSVKWLNEDAESGMPYDFEVVKEGVAYYIDAKGTPSDVKNVVTLSEREWQFMFEKGERYSIYRVYSVGSTSPHIEPINDPGELLRTGEIFPDPITLAI